MVRVLFVCTGNICRSPTAEGAFLRLLRERRLARCVEVDSAGTHDFNVGAPADDRARLVAAWHGIDLGAHRARMVQPEDFAHFDYIVAMDRGNYRNLARLASPADLSKLHLLMEYAPQQFSDTVPDPYGGTVALFEAAFKLIDAGVRGLLANIESTHPSQRTR